MNVLNLHNDVVLTSVLHWSVHFNHWYNLPVIVYSIDSEIVIFQRDLVLDNCAAALGRLPVSLRGARQRGPGRDYAICKIVYAPSKVTPEDMRSKLVGIELLMLAKIVVTPRSLRAYYNFRSVLLVVTPYANAPYRQRRDAGARCRISSICFDQLYLALECRTLLRVLKFIKMKIIIVDR